MKTIFITGASSGLGKATAKLFAKNGWKIIATMRNPAEQTELSDLPDITLMELDVANPDQINSLIAKVTENYEVDVVFNNAGYALAGPLEGTSDEQLVKQFNTNLLGPIRITKAFLPYFRAKARSGLFLNTTSLAALIPDPFMSVYASSKAAFEAWSAAMSFELNKFGICIKTIVPGFMKTNFTGAAELAASTPYTELLDKVIAMFNSPELADNAATPEQVAEIVYEAATDGKSQLQYLAGTDAHDRSARLQQNGKEAMIKATGQFFFG